MIARAKSPAAPGRHEVRDRVATRRLPERRDPARIAAEGRDVALHPRERGELVEQAEVGGASRHSPEEAEQPQAVGDGDHDHVLFRDESGGVHDRQVARARNVRAAVDPDHDGQAVTRRRSRGHRDRQVLAVLVERPLVEGAAEDAVQKRHRALRAGR